jgi:hypothetical protein
MDTLLAYIVSGVCLQIKSSLTAGQLVILSKIEIGDFDTTTSILSLASCIVLSSTF